ncbi:hypothetical protein FRC03_010459 [Tulasnella sp. 419]|nr:hypothetical protein FRC03_010459 [Tulasnella sp. 419]
MSDSTKTKSTSKSTAKGGLPLSIRTRKDKTSVRRKNSRGPAGSTVRRKSSVASKRRSIQTAPKSPVSPSMATPVATARKGSGFFKGLTLFGFGSKKSKRQPVAASPPTQQVQETPSAPVEKVEEPTATVAVADELPKIEATSSDLFAGITSPSDDSSLPIQSPEENSSLPTDESQSLSVEQPAVQAVPAVPSSDKRPISIHDTVPDPASSTDVALAPTPSTQVKDPSPRSPKFKLTVSTVNLDIPLLAGLEAPRSPTSIPLPPLTPGESEAATLFPLITQDNNVWSASDQASPKSPPSLIFSHANGSDSDLLSPLTPATADFSHQVRGRRTSSTKKTEDSILEDETAEDSRSRSRSRSRERSTDGARAPSPLRSGSATPTASKKLSPLTILTPSSEALPKVEESEEDEANPGSGSSAIKFVLSPSTTSPDVPQSAKSEAYARTRTSSLNTDGAQGSGAGIKRSLTLNIFSRDGPTRRRSFFGLGSSKKDKEEDQKTTKQGVSNGDAADQTGSRGPPSRSFTTPSAGTAAERRSSVSTKDSRTITRTPLTLDIRSYGSVGCDIDNLKVKGAGDDTSGTGVVVDEETKRLTESAFFA